MAARSNFLLRPAYVMQQRLCCEAYHQCYERVCHLLPAAAVPNHETTSRAGIRTFMLVPLLATPLSTLVMQWLAGACARASRVLYPQLRHFLRRCVRRRCHAPGGWLLRGRRRRNCRLRRLDVNRHWRRLCQTEHQDTGQRWGARIPSPGHVVAVPAVHFKTAAWQGTEKSMSTSVLRSTRFPHRLSNRRT